MRQSAQMLDSAAIVVLHRIREVWGNYGNQQDKPKADRPKSRMASKSPGPTRSGVQEDHLGKDTGPSYRHPWPLLSPAVFAAATPFSLFSSFDSLPSVKNPVEKLRHLSIRSRHLPRGKISALRFAGADPRKESWRRPRTWCRFWGKIA